MASDCLLQSVFGDFVLLRPFHGKHSLEPVGSALAPQNIGTLRGTVSPTIPKGLLMCGSYVACFFAHGRPWVFWRICLFSNVFGGFAITMSGVFFAHA